LPTVHVNCWFTAVVDERRGLFHELPARRRVVRFDHERDRELVVRPEIIVGVGHTREASIALLPIGRAAAQPL
jgi:hypothetical protein